MRVYSVKSLLIRIKEIRGKCEIHKVGDCFCVEDGTISFPEPNKHLCMYALASLLPLLPAKERKIDEPDDWLPEVREIQCPDPKGVVIWEIIEEH